MELATHCARGIQKLGLAAEQEYNGKRLRTIGIHSRNRLEWVIADMSCWVNSVTSVPFYETLDPEGIFFIADQTQFSTLFLSLEMMNKAIELKKKGRLPYVKNLVCFDEVSLEMKARTELNIIYFKELLDLGKKATDVTMEECQRDTIMTICYTSGTTGTPKGTIIEHGQIRDNVSSLCFTGIFPSLTPGKSLISYLPLAHAYERLMICLTIMLGLKTGFFHGVVSELRDDMIACKPSFFSGVPRILTRFYDLIMKQFKELKGYKKALVQAAIKGKLAHYKSTGNVNHWFYDKLVFNKTRGLFGGNIEVIISGSAPLDTNISDHLKIFIGTYFCQALGQTEVTGACTFSYYHDIDSASCGPPLHRYAVKLVDVPEMQYHATDVINGVPTPRGELCVKGPMTPGYFKLPEQTAEIMDADGWLHTGDIALIAPNGCVKAIDRKKNIFKLQQGEYVAPEKIENILINCPWVMQILIYGNSYQSYLVALIVPIEPVVMNWAKENGIKGSYEDVCATPELNKVILQDLISLSREKKVTVTLTT